MPQSRFMGPGEQPSTDTINEMLAATVPAAGPGIYVDSVPGRGLEIHLDEGTYEQGLGRQSFLARITREGPEGEEDLEGSNYWVREVRLVDRGENALRFISEKNEAEDRAWLKAINLAEFRQETPDDETHLLGLTEEQEADDGTIVDVKLYMEADENGVTNHRPQWVFFGAVGGGAVLPQFKFKEQFGDYLECVTWDGQNEGEDIVQVAKTHLLRQSEFDGKVRNGIRYEYQTPWERTAFRDEKGEAQVIISPYVSGDTLEVNTLEHPIVVKIKREPVELFLLHKDGRAFYSKFVRESK